MMTQGKREVWHNIIQSGVVSILEAFNLLWTHHPPPHLIIILTAAHEEVLSTVSQGRICNIMKSFVFANPICPHHIIKCPPSIVWL